MFSLSEPITVLSAPDGRDAPHTSTSFRPRGGDYHQPGAKRCCCCFGNGGREIRMCLCTVYHVFMLIYIIFMLIYIYTIFYISFILYILCILYLFIMNPDCKKHGGDSPCPLVHDF